MAKWPENRKVIGSRIPRIDGGLKVSGKAKYSFDRNLPGMLHGKILRSPHAHARIKSLDLSSVEQMSGVRSTHIIKNVGAELHYGGDEILAVAAETEELARDALRAIRIEYEVLPHVASEEQARKVGGEYMKEPREREKGDVDKALAEAHATIEGTYGAGVVTHVCL